MVAVIMVMMVGLSSHIHNCCAHRQHRRILILNELADTLYDKKEEQRKPEYQKYLHFLISLFTKGPHRIVRPFVQFTSYWLSVS